MGVLYALDRRGGRACRPTIAAGTHLGRVHRAAARDVGTELAPETADDPELAARLDDLLHRTCHLARALTGAEQAALKVDPDGDGIAARKFFNLSERYERWRDYRVDPQGLGLHGITLQAGQVVRLTQAQVEAHPAWQAFGTQAGKHPPLRGWLAAPVCGEGGRHYGLVQLSDKTGGADFTPDDEERIRELAAFAGATWTPSAQPAEPKGFPARLLCRSCSLLFWGAARAWFCSS